MKSWRLPSTPRDGGRATVSTQCWSTLSCTSSATPSSWMNCSRICRASGRAGCVSVRTHKTSQSLIEGALYSRTCAWVRWPCPTHLFWVGGVRARKTALRSLKVAGPPHCCANYLCETRLDQFQPFQFQPVGVHVRKVVLRLLNKPAFGAAAENFGQSHGHFRRYAALFVHQFG